MPAEFTIRPAEQSDSKELSELIGREYYIHRHLDWKLPQKWLGSQPYWLLFARNRLHAALACPPDPPLVAWIRLFVTSVAVPPTQAWKPLFAKCLETFSGQPEMMIAAVGLQRWFIEMLEHQGFQHHQDIVVLAWDNHMPEERPLKEGFFVRKMRRDDLEEVARIDQEAFEPLWQNSLEGVTLAFEQAAYSTVVEHEGRPVAFQISTSTALATHLARLAVLPELQGQKLGYALVYDLFNFFRRNGSWQLTVNTQNTNRNSLALYQSMGFELTGDRFPVYLYPRG